MSLYTRVMSCTLSYTEAIHSTRILRAAVLVVVASLGVRGHDEDDGGAVVHLAGVGLVVVGVRRVRIGLHELARGLGQFLAVTQQLARQESGGVVALFDHAVQHHLAVQVLHVLCALVIHFGPFIFLRTCTSVNALVMCQRTRVSLTEFALVGIETHLFGV